MKKLAKVAFLLLCVFVVGFEVQRDMPHAHALNAAIWGFNTAAALFLVLQ